MAFELLLPDELRIHPVFHISLLEPDVENIIAERARPNPPPILLDDGNHPLFEVDAIVSTIYRRQLQYLVHWKGYTECDRTWEPAKTFSTLGDSCAEVRDRRFSRREPRKTETSRRGDYNVMILSSCRGPL